ncbi:YdeI/OmpD-associated family protein [Dactylosporangium sp. NBC_01737]|uniref:YdeI/OmpD-associated family protein n=1 Tax=Dactylosporangium sp. NBC_01737 TaxID=2975959 RepID=UPI002E1538C0|nr:YdeI/OmpD-associated family protein [Dactylosporangium sp. NBC_01737]
MRFRATLFLGGKTATGMKVPAEVVESFGRGKKPRVLVTINGYTYRSTVAVYGGEYMLPVSAEVRAGAGIAAGDEIDVDLELDTAPRVVEVPADLAAALTADPAAKARFDGLSYSNQRQHVLALDGAKTAETRQRRLDKTLAALRVSASGRCASA